MQEQIDELNRKLDRVLALYEQENWPDRMVLFRELELRDKNGVRIFSSKSDGLSLGFPTGKVGVYGVTPVTQAAGISSPSGGATVDAQSRTAITSIITALHNIGILA